MTAEQLTLYFDLFLVALILLGALRGYVQGFKKSLFKLIKGVVFWAGFFLTADLFANFMLNSTEVFGLIVDNIPVPGNPANMFELVQCLLVEYLGVDANSAIDTSISFAFAFVSIILKLVYLFLYVTVISFFYWIVCGIIWKIINRKEIEIQYKEKKLKSGKIKRKKKKVDLRPAADGPRFLGLIFGAGRSMIGVTLIVSLVMSVISFIPEKLLNSFSDDSNVTASNQMVLSDQNKGTIKEALTGFEEYIKFIDDLDNSPFVKLVRTIESDGKTLDLVLFDTVMNGNYEEYNIKTRESLANVIEIGYEVTLILDTCITPDNQIDLSLVDYDHVASLVEHIADVDLIMDAIPAVIELGLSIDAVQEELPIPVDEELKETINSIDWEHDIVALANIVRILADLDDINQVIANPLELLSKENEPVIYNIITELSNLTLVTEVLPSVVEYALSLEDVQEIIGNATVDLSNIVWKDELVQVAEIYSVFQTLCSDITSLLFAKEINAEDIIDGINLNALKDLIVKVFELGIMEQLFEPIMDMVVSNIEDESIREMLNFDVDNYGDWAKEFTIVIDIVKELLAGENPFKYGVDVNIIKNLNAETILKSEILSQVIVSALVDASNGEGVFAGEGAQELSEFIDVPAYLKNKDAVEWYNQYDEEGKLIYKGQLHVTLEGLKSILPESKESVMKVNDTKTLAYEVSGVEDAIVVWSSSNPEVATINQNGVITALNPGHTVIFASAANGKVYDTIDVVVKGEGVVPVEKVYIEGQETYEITIGIGQANRYFLSASTNLDATNQVLTWTSLDETIVKVSKDGAVEGLKVGSTIVKAISNADPTKFATCTVTVVENLPDVIKVNKDSLIGHPNKTFYVDASINNSKEGLTYTVVNPSVASVDEEGFVTLLTEGETKLIIKNKEETITKELDILVVSYTSPTGVKIVTGTEGLDVNGILSSLDENDIETITNSDILTRSLSKILLNALETSASSGGMEIHFPTSVIETDGETKYISKTEIKTILSILLEVDISAVLEGGDATALLSDLNDETVDKILESKILSSFLASTISSVGEGMIVVPSTAYQLETDTCYKHPTTEIKYLKNSEVKALVNMLKDYDLLSGNDIAIPLSEDNSDLTQLLESSDILRATLSKYVLDLSQGSNSMITVPDQAIEEKGGCKLLAVTEFEAVLDALYDLGFEEISASLSFDLNVGDLTNAVDSVNNSIILRATITDLLADVEQIVVPDQANDSNTYTVSEEEIKVLSKEELSSLVSALSSVLGEETSFENISLSLTVGTLKDSLDDIKSSLILKATVSDIISTLDVVVVPDQASDNNSYTLDGNKIPVLYNDELEGLVNSLVGLLGEETNVENIELNLTIGDLKDSLEDIKSSKIIMATISDVITTIDAIVVPDQATDNENYTVDGNVVSVLYGAELDSLVNTLVSLLGEESSIDNLDLNLTVGDLESSLEDIVDSKILMATISDVVTSLDVITIPDQAVDKVSYTVNDEAVSVLLESELTTLVNALVDLLGVNTSVDSIELNLTVGDLQDSLTDLTNSKILMATVSDKVVPLDAIVVPDQVLDTTTYTVDNASISVLHVSEFEYLVGALVTLLGEESSIDNIQLDLTVGDLQDAMSDLTSSKILMATISDKVVPLDAIVVPDQSLDKITYTVDDANISVLLNTELDSLINTLVTLLGRESSIDNIQLNLTVGDLQDSLDNIKDSKILMATISDKIVPLDGIIVPDQAVDKVNYSVNDVKISVLLDEEFDGLINTLVTLLGENTSVDSIELNLTVGDLKDSVVSINNSSILRTTVSDKIIPLSAIVIPDQVIENDLFSKGSTKYPVLTKEELVAMVNSLESLLGPSTSINNLELGLTVGQLNNSVDSINLSAILRATISDKINELSALIKPDQAYGDGVFTHNESSIKVLKKQELKSLTTALEALLGANTSIDGLSLNLTVGKLKDAVVAINASGILKATVGDKIINNAALVTPDQVVDSITYTSGSTKLKVLVDAELETLVETLVTLLGANASVDSLSLDLKAKDLKASIDAINASGILRSTISDKIINNAALITPDEAIEDDIYTINTSKLLVLEQAELKALISALVDILGEDTELDSISLDLSVGDLKAAVTAINSTKVIRATISDKINDVSALTKPNEAYASGFNKNGSSIKVLTTSELSGLVDALVALLGEETELDSINLSLTVKDLYDSTTSINNSLILRTTITEKIEGSLDVPADAIDNVDYHVGASLVNVLSKEELTALAKALVNILGGGTSLDNFVIPMDIFNSLLSASDNPSKNKLEQSLESVIIWDKISTMISSSTGSLIVIPDDARVGNLPSGRITVKEINSLMVSLNVLGVGSIDSVSLNANFIFDLDDVTKDAQGNTELTRTTIALEKSKILMASIPSLFEEGIASAYEDDISISFAGIQLTGTLNAEETAYVSEGELVRLFRAARAANILKSKTLADLSGKISNPNSPVSRVNSLFLTLYASEVLRPTVKQVLVSLTSGIDLGLNGVELTEETIPVILAKAAAINDLQAYAQLKAQGQNGLTQVQIGMISSNAATNIYAATSVSGVETIYDNAVSSIDALVA